jgi:hypothetical protein
MLADPAAIQCRPRHRAPARNERSCRPDRSDVSRPKAAYLAAQLGIAGMSGAIRFAKRWPGLSEHIRAIRCVCGFRDLPAPDVGA